MHYQYLLCQCQIQVDAIEYFINRFLYYHTDDWSSIQVGQLDDLCSLHLNWKQIAIYFQNMTTTTGYTRWILQNIYWCSIKSDQNPAIKYCPCHNNLGYSCFWPKRNHPETSKFHNFLLFNCYFGQITWHEPSKNNDLILNHEVMYQFIIHTNINDFTL